MAFLSRLVNFVSFDNGKCSFWKRNSTSAPPKTLQIKVTEITDTKFLWNGVEELASPILYVNHNVHVSFVEKAISSLPHYAEFETEVVSETTPTSSKTVLFAFGNLETGNAAFEFDKTALDNAVLEVDPSKIDSFQACDDQPIISSQTQLERMGNFQVEAVTSVDEGLLPSQSNDYNNIDNDFEALLDGANDPFLTNDQICYGTFVATDDQISCGTFDATDLDIFPPFNFDDIVNISEFDLPFNPVDPSSLFASGERPPFSDIEWQGYDDNTETKTENRNELISIESSSKSTNLDLTRNKDQNKKIEPNLVENGRNDGVQKPIDFNLQSTDKNKNVNLQISDYGNTPFHSSLEPCSRKRAMNFNTEVKSNEGVDIAPSGCKYLRSSDTSRELNTKAARKYRESKKEMAEKIKGLEQEASMAQEQSKILQQTIELILDLTCKSENEDEMFQKICRLVSSFLKNIKTNTFSEKGMESILFQKRIMPIIRKRYSKVAGRVATFFMVDHIVNNTKL